MTVLRQYFVGSLVAAIFSGQMAVALPHSPSERAKLFATCAGHLGALAVQQRTAAPVKAPETEAMRQTFEMLLDAVMPDAVAHGMPESTAYNWRFNAWLDNADILNEVAFSFDETRAQRAQQLVDARLATCRDLLLPP